MPIQAIAADNSVHEFPNGTPDAVIDGAMKRYAQEANAKAPQEPNPVIDVARTLPGGLAKGLAGTVGLPSTAINFITNKVGKLAGREEIPDEDPRAATFLGLPTVGQANKTLSAPTGGFYEPKTTAGRYAETAASFAPALAGGSAGIGAKLLGRVLAPAAAVQSVGSIPALEAHPNVKAAAEIAAAVLAHGGVSGARAGVRALAADPAPELTAENHLARIAQNNGITPETINANSIAGRGQLGAEAMGPQGVATLGTLGRRSGTTAEGLANALTTRAATAPTRIMDDFAASAGIHPEAARGNIDALVDAGRERAGPLFDRALSIPGGVMTPALEELLKRPIIQKGMAQAAEDIRNDGGDPTRYGLHFDESGAATQVSHPTAEAWDLVKKAVGQSVERDAFGRRLPDSASRGNARISNANRELSGAMSDAIPGYGDALAASGDYLSLRSAFDAGQSHILDARTTAAQVAEHVARLTPPQVEAYRGGIANEVFNKAQNARLAPRLLNTPAVQNKLSAALGQENAQRFMTGLGHEMDLARTGGRMMPGTNSITSDVLLQAGEQDHAANLGAALQGARAVGSAARGDVIGAAHQGINAIRHFAPDLLRSGGMSVEVRNNLGRLLSLPPEDLAATLRRLQQPGSGDRLARTLQNIGN